MSLNIRRVVTGHDKNGRATVKIDEVAKNVVSARPGASAAVIWTTEGFPVNNNGDADESGRKVGTTLNNGDRRQTFHCVRDGDTVHLKAGDVMVQRGTIHNWVNKGREPCVIAFTLVAADPVNAGGKVLHAHG